MKALDENIIEKYLRGECTDVEIHCILDWIEDSDENKRELFNLKLISSCSRFEQYAEASHVDSSYREFLRLAEYKKSLEKSITRKITLRLLRYAASVLILIGLAAGGVFWINRPPQSDLITVAVGANQAVRKIVLEDSTLVWLFENSQIRYPKKFAKDSRTVSIVGKVFFEVAKNPKKPFLVDVGGYLVKALGTSFEVTNYKNQQRFDVVLLEGLVEISNKTSGHLSMIRPNEQIEVNKTNNRFNLKEVNAGAYTSWISGVLEFDGMTFPEIAKILERYYNVKIMLKAPEKMKQQLVGSLNLKKDIHDMMKTIELVVPIKYSIETNTYVYIDDK